MPNIAALAQDQTYPHLDSNIALNETIETHGFESGTIGAKACLAGPMDYHISNVGLSRRCRHVCGICESMLITHTASGKTGGSTKSKVVATEQGGEI